VGGQKSLLKRSRECGKVIRANVDWKADWGTFAPWSRYSPSGFDARILQNPVEFCAVHVTICGLFCSVRGSSNGAKLEGFASKNGSPFPRSKRNPWLQNELQLARTNGPMQNPLKFENGAVLHVAESNLSVKRAANQTT
jgi:hypothetical protein